jgi:MFS family permease
LGDAITERLGYKGTLMMDALLISTGLGLAIGFPHPIIVILGFGLVGIGVATIIPIVYTLAWKNSRMPVSAALAAVSTVGFSGFLVGPPVIGFLAHLFTLRMALLLICVLAFVILFLSGRVKA